MGVSLVRVRETGNPGELWGCCTVGRTTTICLSDYSINSWQAAWSCHFVRVFWAKSLEPCSFYVTEIGRWYRKLFFKILYVKWICSHAFLTMGCYLFFSLFFLSSSDGPVALIWVFTFYSVTKSGSWRIIIQPEGCLNSYPQRSFDNVLTIKGILDRGGEIWKRLMEYNSSFYMWGKTMCWE